MKSFKGMGLAQILAMAQMNNAMMGGRPVRREDPLRGVDIIKEYFLIQEKKSGLSRRLREMVIDRYEEYMERTQREFDEATRREEVK